MVKDKAREWHECRERLRAYKLKLAKCNNSLDQWTRTWGGFEDETYIHFWSAPAYNMVEALLKDLLGLSSQIRRLIQGKSITQGSEKDRKASLLERMHKHKEKLGRSESLTSQARILEGPSRDDWSKWFDLTRSWRQHSFEQVQTLAPDLLHKVAFALYQNSLLEDLLSRMDQTTEDLDVFTRTQFRLMQASDVREPVNNRELQRFDKMKKYWDQLNAYATAVHLGLAKLQPEQPWCLELRIPDPKGNVLTVDHYDDVDMDFALCLDGDDDDGGVWERVRINFQPTSSDMTIAENLASQVISRHLRAQADKRAKFSRLPAPKKRSLPLRTLLQDGIFQRQGMPKAWEKDRARLLLGLCNWTIMLWNSPWTQTICCCGIRFHNQVEPPRQYLFSDGDHMKCRNHLLATLKLALLGIAITELTIGKQLRISFEDLTKTFHASTVTEDSATDAGTVGLRGQSIEYFDEWTGSKEEGVWARRSRSEILRQVKSVTNSLSYCEALEYCFDNPMLFSSPYMGPEVVDTLGRNVFQP